jgi:lipoprotein NlpD
VHTVRRGETLYAIAWRYGTDFRSLARVNGIASPYTIYPGQRLRLRASRKPATETSARTSRPAKKPSKPSNAAPGKRRGSAPAPSPSVARWSWPAKGAVIGRFGGSGGKGIDIGGRAGAPVKASAAGRVVYSGSGLRGYGKLIIIKHNERYLSAYAHNKKLHAKEGDKVQSGQRIAEMGQSDTDRIKLHFEIRRDGKPVDPLKHLPG